MVGKGGRTNVLGRIEALELHSVDSRPGPELATWLGFWQEQLRLCCAGKEYMKLVLERARAAMREYAAWRGFGLEAGHEQSCRETLSGALFVAQRNHGIDAHRPPRGPGTRP